jgi:predicted enzyme related to lactoylglutathione lyase
MSRVVHFEFSAKDPEKAAVFYKNVFGWQTTKWEGPVDYWPIETGDPDKPGINGGFYKPEDGQLSGTINTMEVDDIEAVVKKVKDNGGKVVAEKMPIPGVGYQAYCSDGQGTVFGIHQVDESAG